MAATKVIAIVDGISDHYLIPELPDPFDLLGHLASVRTVSLASSQRFYLFAFSESLCATVQPSRSLETPVIATPTVKGR